jgi:hypothetical protein
MKTERIPSACAVLLIVILPVLYYGCGYPFTKLFFLVEPGKIAERVYSADSFRAGRLPLWNPYFDSGHPHAACLQPASWYPPNLLYTVLDPGAATNVIALLHYAAAGVFTWLFVRAIGLSVIPSLFSAVSFMFCGYLTARLPFPDILASSVWLPLVLYFAHRIVSGGGAGCVAGVAVALCLQILAGHTEPALYTATLGGAYALYFGFADRAVRAWWRPVAIFVIAVCAGLALSAVQLLPLHEVSSLSVKRGIDYAEFTTWSLHPLLFAAILFPYAFGTNAPGFYGGWYWGPWNYFETSCYTGLLSLCLALLALVLLLRSERQVRFWGAAAAAALFLALGRYNPLYRIVFYIPVYNLFRAPARHCLEFSFAVAVLAGFGLRHALAARDPRARRALCFLATGLLLVVVFSPWEIAGLRKLFIRGLPAMSAGISPSALRQTLAALALSQNAFAVPLFLMCGTSAALALLAFRPRRRATPLLLLALLFVDLLSCGSFYWRRDISGERMIESRRRFLAPALAAMRAGGEAPDRFRVCSFLRAEEDMDDLGTVYERFGPIRSVNGFGMMLSQDYAAMLATDIWGATADPLYRNGRVLSMLGVRYIIARPGDRAFLLGVRTPGGRAPYRELFNNGTVALFENADVLPPAWCAGSLRPVKDFAEALRILWDPASGIDLRREALVEGGDAPHGRGTGEARITARNPDRIAVECSSPDGTFLVLAERYFPGWKAYLDGAETRVYRTNGILRGVVLPPGRHRVEFVYRPFSFVLGACVSGAMLLILAAACTLSGAAGLRTKRCSWGLSR